jgi:hypothetical protein
MVEIGNNVEGLEEQQMRVGGMRGVVQQRGDVTGAEN